MPATGARPFSNCAEISEPQLRRLASEFGNKVTITMGGSGLLLNLTEIDIGNDQIQFNITST